jgi:hypothetical protein
MTKVAEHLLQKNRPNKATHFLGTAFETAEIIFDKRLANIPQHFKNIFADNSYLKF